MPTIDMTVHGNTFRAEDVEINDAIITIVGHFVAAATPEATDEVKISALARDLDAENAATRNIVDAQK